MGTKVHCKSYSPGQYLMRDFNEDTNSRSWSQLCVDKTLSSGECYRGCMSRSIPNAHPEHHKDSLKHKMLEHEAIFKNQVYELHRIYRTQRDMMEEIRRGEVHRQQLAFETSSSSLQGCELKTKEARNWNIPSSVNSRYPRASKSGALLVGSPLSVEKGSDATTSKDCEVLEVRPSKVRKRMFNLQLPADEYIDTEEKEPFHDNNIANRSMFHPKGNGSPAGKHDNFLLDGCARENFDCRRATATASCLRSPLKLADLNEPVQVGDGALPSSAAHLLNSANHRETNDLNKYAKPSGGYICLYEEIKQKSQSEFPDFGNCYDIKWLSGLKRNNLTYMPKRLQYDQLPLHSNKSQVGFRSHAISSTECGATDLWRGTTDSCLGAIDRIHDNFSQSHSESVIKNQIWDQHEFVNPSKHGNTSEFSWRRSSLTEKQTSLNAYPFLNSSSNTPAQINNILGERWNSKGNSRLNQGLGDLPTINGFYHGTSSRSKEMLALDTSDGFRDLHSNGSVGAMCDSSINFGSEMMLKRTKPVKFVNLNLSYSNSLPNEARFLQDVEVLEEKTASNCDVTVLPWLVGRPATTSKAVNTKIDTYSDDSSLCKASPRHLSQNDLNKKLQISSERKHYKKKQNDEVQNSKRIMGFSIFDKPSMSTKEVLSPVSTLVAVHHSLPGVKPETERRSKIDINLACEEEVPSEVLAVDKEIDNKLTHSRVQIDLNSCISEEEESLAPFDATTTSCVQVVMNIDLEAPILETEDDRVEQFEQHKGSFHSMPKSDQIQEEVAWMAAEAIVLLSSSTQGIQGKENACQRSKDHLAASLLLLTDVICTPAKKSQYGEEVKSSDDLPIVKCFGGMDDFEVMTLQLQETKEEDYMPHPFVLEEKMEDTETNSLSNRPRKGQGRRGRQRRDFLRDVLPGMASLSRHEVNEDLQAFEGLMKAIGHAWSPGSARRKGSRNRSGRGKQRLVIDSDSTAVERASCTTLMEQLNNIEVFLENYSLKGWGKKSRRPRRNRCPAGNPPAAIPLA